MASENKLPLDTSKDKMEKYEVLQAKQPASLLDDQTDKLQSLQSSAPIRINVPINPSIETIGALCELESVEDSECNRTTLQITEKDHVNNKDDNLPKSVEELILFEHNYAANLSVITFDRCKNVKEMLLKKENSTDSKKIITESEKCEPEKIATQSEKCEPEKLATQSEKCEPDKIAIQAEEPESKTVVTQSEKSETKKIEIQSEKYESKKVGIQSEKSESKKIATQSEKYEIEKIGIQSDKSISTNVEATNTHVDESDFLNVSPPVRRSRRQIEKLEREQVEKDAASCISTASHQNTPVKKEKFVTAKEKDVETLLTCSQDMEKIPDLVDSNKALNCHPNYKNFSEFKKRHLKIVIQDCQSEQNKKFIFHSDISDKIQNNLNNACGSIGDSPTAVKEVTDMKNSDNEPKPKITQKKKVIESECIGTDEKMPAEVPRLRKRKHLLQPKKCSMVEKSLNAEESKVVKDELEPSPKRKILAKTKSNKVEVPSESKTFIKAKHLLSDKSFEGDNDTSDTIQSGRRKKCVSFSDELISVDKCEAPAKKRRISVDNKDSGQKLAPTPALTKSHKKKVIRRENSRLAVSEDEPPLFSSPDVMVKVKTDDSLCKKEEKEDSLCKKDEKENSLCKKDVSLCKKDEKEDSLCNKDIKEDSLCKKVDSLCNKDIKEDSLCKKVDSLCKNEEKEDGLCENEEKKSSLSKKEDGSCKREDKDVPHLHSDYVLTTVTTDILSVANEKFENPNDKKTELTLNTVNIDQLNDGNLSHPQILQETGCKFINQNLNLSKQSCDTALDSNVETVSEKEICSPLHQVEYKVRSDEIDNEPSVCFHEEKGLTVDKNEVKPNEAKGTNTDAEVPNLLESSTIFLESGELNEDNPKPERKSRRLIKKKEFFEDVLNTSANKKIEAKKPNVEKEGSGKKMLRKSIKSKVMEKGEDSDTMKSHSESETDSSEEDDPKKLWCICRKPHNSRFMIQCDKCEDWFHGSCVGITKQYGRQLEKLKKEWNCPNCHMKGVSMASETSSCDTEIQDKKAYRISNEKCTTTNEEFSSDSQKISSDTNIVLSDDSKHHSVSPIIDHKDMLSTCAAVIESNEVKKESINLNNVKVSRKSSKLSTTKALDVQHKSSMSPKKSLKASELLPRLSVSTKQSSTMKDIPHTKKEISTKLAQHTVDKTTLPANPKKTFNPVKEKKNPIRKKLNCINCQSEAMPNSCYCNTECLEKYAAECLKNMRESKEGPKGVDFDNQRLVVLDRLRGSVITSDHGPTAREIVSWLKLHPSYMIACSPGLVSSVKKETACQKKESDVNCSTGKKSDDDTAKTTVRLNVRKTLKNILIERCKNSGDIKMPEDDIQKIAVRIEEELQSLFKDNSFKYRAKYRSLMFNIKDPRNQGLFRKILTGAIQPDRLVRMSSEELASMELARWREQENQHLLDMIKRVQLEHQNVGGGLLLKKTHKGEVEIEDDMTSIIEQDVPKIVSKDVPEEIEPEKEVAKDTTHLHRSHLFDLNCKICTGKVVPPPTDENVLKKVRVAHSITVDVSSSNPSDSADKPLSKTVDGKSPVSSTGEDSMDQEPTSTVSIGSPDISIKSNCKGNKVKALSVWKGFIFMQDVAKFVTSAYKVSGQTDQLHSDLPDTVQVCGRIIPDQVWEYLGKIKQSGNKELIVIRFQAANEEEAVTYHSFYTYLSTRKRYGVVSNYSKKIKDFYILPLAATSPVPMVLVPFDGPGLPSPRPHLLLGVIVRHKLKQMLLPAAPKPLPASKIELENIDGSYTPPHEPRSYTPPLPALPSTSKNSENELNNAYSPVIKVKEVSELRKHPMCNKIENIKNVLENKGVNDENFDARPPEKPDSVLIPIERDEDKPYDPEQDVLCIPSVIQKEKLNPLIEKPASDNLESHIKILDALTRQVEETDRQVNALKELISHPEDDGGLPSLNSQPLDINSIAESGMSSFLDLPESLQDIFNTVRLKTHEKDKETEVRVNMQLKKSFVLHTSEPKPDKTLHSINSQATPPPTIDDKNSSSVKCLSDPRIKLRTNFQDAFASNEPPPMSEKKVLSQKQLVEAEMVESIHSNEYTTEIPSSSCNKLSSAWSSTKEPAPPGLEFTDSNSQQNATIINSLPDNTSAALYASNHMGPNSSSHVVSGFRSQPPHSFQAHLPPGFSVHTPPPNIKHFPPPPIVSTSFPPPPLPIQVPPSEGNDNSLKESWQPLQLSKHQGSAPHWDKTLQQQEMLHIDDSHYYPSGDSNDYLSENMYKSKSSNTHWTRPSRFLRGRWNKNSRGNRQDNQRRGRIGVPYRRNHRN